MKVIMVGAGRINPFSNDCGAGKTEAALRKMVNPAGSIQNK